MYLSISDAAAQCTVHTELHTFDTIHKVYLLNKCNINKIYFKNQVHFIYEL